MLSSPVYISSFRRRLLEAIVWHFLGICEQASVHSRWGISNSKETIYPSELWKRCATSSSKGLNKTAEALFLKKLVICKVVTLQKSPLSHYFFFSFFSKQIDLLLFCMCGLFDLYVSLCAFLVPIHQRHYDPFPPVRLHLLEVPQSSQMMLPSGD